MNSQAAEKAARAICEFEGKPVGITRSLGQIANLLPISHEMREGILALDRLSSASTKFRYPNPAGRLAQPPMPADLLDDIEEVGRFIDSARNFARIAREPLYRHPSAACQSLIVQSTATPSGFGPTITVSSGGGLNLTAISLFTLSSV